MKRILIVGLIALAGAATAFGRGTPEPMEEPALPTIAEIAAADEQFSTLVNALDAAGLVDTLNGDGPFTVFAPTDDAFEALPAGALDGLLGDTEALTEVLLYHVAPGSFMASDVVSISSADTAAGKSVRIMTDDMGVMVGGARVSVADIEASNGVIHVIDAVMIPPTEMAMADIVDIAVEDGRFTTLVTALGAADLVDTLRGDGPFTVFAPTNDAFAKLPAGTIDALLNDIPTLSNILLYHVVPGRVAAADVVNLSSADTAAGQQIRIEVMDGSVMINDAQVIITDIEAENGIIHVIDTVILPS